MSSPDPTPRQPTFREASSVDESDSAPSTAAKPRSRFERLLVRGLIVVGLILVAIEGWPRLQYALDFRALEKAVLEADKSDQGVVESEARKLVTRYSAHEVQKNLPSNELASPRVDTYSYRGLLGERKLYVYYGHTRGDEEPEVLAVLAQPVEFVHATPPEPADEMMEIEVPPKQQ